jgi:putative transposase
MLHAFVGNLVRIPDRNDVDFAMWTPTTRQQHNRPITRYQTDLTDAEWRVIAPHLPKPCATGRPRAWPMREIVNGIFYVMRAGAQDVA